MSAPAKEPSATYTLNINAVSGYQSTTIGVCTASQYAAAIGALHGRLPASNYDELLAAVLELIAARNAEGGPKFGLIHKPATREHEMRESRAWHQLHTVVDKFTKEKT